MSLMVSYELKSQIRGNGWSESFVQLRSDHNMSGSTVIDVSVVIGAQ